MLYDIPDALLFLSVIFWLAGYKYTLAGRAAIYNQLSTILIILRPINDDITIINKIKKNISDFDGILF